MLEKNYCSREIFNFRVQKQNAAFSFINVNSTLSMKVVFRAVYSAGQTTYDHNIIIAFYHLRSYIILELHFIYFV